MLRKEFFRNGLMISRCQPHRSRTFGGLVGRLRHNVRIDEKISIVIQASTPTATACCWLESIFKSINVECLSVAPRIRAGEQCGLSRRCSGNQHTRHGERGRTLEPHQKAKIRIAAGRGGVQEGEEFGFVRVLNVSGGDAPARIDVNNIEAEKDFRGIMTYTHSKSVLEAMSVALAQDMKPTNVSVRASEHRDDEELDIRTSAGTDEAHTSFFQVFLPRRRREICEAGGALYSVGLQERCRFRCCDWSYYRGRYLQVL